MVVRVQQAMRLRAVRSPQAIPVELLDDVVLLGRQGNDAITADELADIAGTISYEILLSISERVPRVYTKD